MKAVFLSSQARSVFRNAIGVTLVSALCAEGVVMAAPSHAHEGNRKSVQARSASAPTALPASTIGSASNPSGAPSPLSAIAAADMRPSPPVGGNGSVADAFAGVGQSLVSRSIALRQLGVPDTDPLDTTSSVREYYFPVPEGVPLGKPTLQFDGSYLRGDGGRTTLVLSLDGSPVSSRGITASDGDAGQLLGVSGAARDRGFLRLGVRWWTILDVDRCVNQPFRGNILRVDTNTRLNYTYDTNAIRDLRGAWSALPREPSVVVGASHVSSGAFDAAWRIGTLLEQDGNAPRFHAFPKTGDTINLSNVTVPAALRAIPAFAALNGSGNHTLANDAEAAALLVVGSARAFPADFVVMDDALRTQINRESDALRLQVGVAGPQATAAYDAWRSRALGGLTAPLDPGQARVAHVAGQAIIVLADRKAVDTFSSIWRPINVSNNLIVHDAVNPIVGRSDRISLAALGAQPQAVSVQRVTDWSALFDLGAVSSKGRAPKQVVLDLAGTPDSENTPVVASVFMNDTLIGAKLLTMDGREQRLSVDIPQYTLRARSQLRIHFERESNTGCRNSEGGPVAILPTSHLQLGTATPTADFTGMAARFADGVDVIVPQAYLDSAPDSLARVSRLATVSMVSPHHATLTVVPAGQKARLSGTFLAVDAPMDDLTDSPLALSNDRMKITAPDNRVIWDANGMGRRDGADAGVGMVDVEHAGDYYGIVYRHAGPGDVRIANNLDIGPGNVAIFDHTGLLKGLDTNNLDGINASGLAKAAAWARLRLSWVIPLALLVAFLIVLLVAAVARGRASRRRELAAHNRGLAFDDVAEPRNGNGNGNGNGARDKHAASGSAGNASARPTDRKP
ncbi:cellulose biosynthesis cyclic di-GMP-binding regulatory protein BcsB [Robbsia andropogonis]|uniref:cellulose biosynthesis cyclic di-GMP-binding regulatory protein BcsB n=1 Tax=Robbsia andropogonis TaxID=28092 RepID=UPI000A65E026|nr:cellulose biosynthesis cyclic di-GMP-binding regulatory protein BcsB [Robbsia andropogonis]